MFMFILVKNIPLQCKFNNLFKTQGVLRGFGFKGKELEVLLMGVGFFSTIKILEGR